MLGTFSPPPTSKETVRLLAIPACITAMAGEGGGGTRHSRRMRNALLHIWQEAYRIRWHRDVGRNLKSTLRFSICVPHIDDLAQDYSNSIVNPMELQQSCAKPSICCLWEDIKESHYSHCHMATLLLFSIKTPLPPVTQCHVSFSLHLNESYSLILVIPAW